jgi:D-tyrosyl-tRNA(Tyr) deacylase
VLQARVDIAGHTHGAIGAGMLVFICAEPADTLAEPDRLVAKLLKMRIFSDDQGKMNRSVADVGGGLLMVSQFTLAADVWQGNRPSFAGAADADLARSLCEHAVALARARHPLVATGIFGADMQVHLVNDGPVTIPITVRP